MPENALSDDGSTTALLMKIRKALLDGDLTMAHAMEFTDEIADAAKNGGMPDDQLCKLKANLSTFLLTCQAEKEQLPKSASGQTFSPPILDDAIDRLWETIKANLPPHMIDTPEKCDQMAKHVGFLVGFWGERSVHQILRRLGVVP